MVVSSFLNTAIGKLYGRYSDEFIEQHLQVVGLSADDAELLNDIVIPNTKSFFENQSNENSIIGE